MGSRIRLLVALALAAALLAVALYLLLDDEGTPPPPRGDRAGLVAAVRAGAPA